jgi:tRNA threonylcarbamoyladenosine biosynthesis protein TsaE
MVAYKNLDLNQVKKLAGELARQLRNRKALIGFQGPLGSGKTTFIKAFAKSLGVKNTSSPTFVIAHEHTIRQGKLFHLDFYRLKKSKELVNLGLSDMLKNKNLILVEWVDRFPKIASLCDIIISFNVKKGDKRDVILKTR